MTTDTVRRPFGFQSLLTPDGYNPKTKKGRARGYATAILHFAPARLGGQDVCQYRSAGCTAACLNTAGRGGIIRKGESTNLIQLARLARKKAFFERRTEFNALLKVAIEAHVRRALKRGMAPMVRLNGTSDLPWERLPITPDGRTVFDVFPGVQFYDYTKNPHRAIANARGEHPANYHLTFSRSEENTAEVREVLAAGGNVAVVFANTLPATFADRPVINGDADDLRPLDPRGGVIVGLKAKGRGKRDMSGFVVRPAA